jgi:hypothetical protein
MAGMDERIEAFYHRYVREQGAAVPAHGLIYFGHLYAEYRSVRTAITDHDSINLIEEIHRRWAQAEKGRPLTWNDVYAFDLELTKYLPPESLLRKAYELRDRYRSVAGHREYDAYMATKPPDLTTIGIPRTKTSHRTSASTTSEDSAWLDEVVEAALREDVKYLSEDVKYLMSRVYLEYALTPLREGIRTELTRKGVRWTVTFVVCLAACIVISLVGTAFPEQRLFYTLARISTLGVIVAAGIVGGLVSMLQRIQAASSDADALHSIDSLTNGWRGIFLAPLSGAIFASLLFALFAGGILKGSIFPDIRASVAPPMSAPAKTKWLPASAPKRPDSGDVSQATGQESTAQLSSVNTPTPAPTAAGAATTEDGPDTSAGQQTPPVKASPGRLTPGPTPPSREHVVSSSGVNAVPFTSFLTDTGPASGADFALLIVWSFIAGFAERLVPDTLNRLVTKASPPTG